MLRLSTKTGRCDYCEQEQTKDAAPTCIVGRYALEYPDYY